MFSLFCSRRRPKAPAAPRGDRSLIGVLHGPPRARQPRELASKKASMPTRFFRQLRARLRGEYSLELSEKRFRTPESQRRSPNLRGTSAVSNSDCNSAISRRGALNSLSSLNRSRRGGVQQSLLCSSNPRVEKASARLACKPPYRLIQVSVHRRLLAYRRPAMRGPRQTQAHSSRGSAGPRERAGV